MFLNSDEHLHLLLSKGERLDEFFFRKFVSGTFDHDDLGFVTDVNEIEIALLTHSVCWVHDELAVHTTNTDCADRSCERNVGNAKSCGSAVHRKDVGIVFAISAHEESDDLGVVVVALREQRTQWAVRHAAGKDFLFGRTAFTLEVATREFASCGGLFLVFNGERKEVLTVFDLRCGNGGDDDDGVTHADGDGAVSELG